MMYVSKRARKTMDRFYRVKVGKCYVCADPDIDTDVGLFIGTYRFKETIFVALEEAKEIAGKTGGEVIAYQICPLPEDRPAETS